MASIRVTIDDRVRMEKPQVSLDTVMAVARILEKLVDDFGLPKKNLRRQPVPYELVRAVDNTTLDPEQTLASVGVEAGETLKLVSKAGRRLWRTIQETLDEIEGELKDEVVDHVTEELFNELDERLTKMEETGADPERVARLRSRLNAVRGVWGAVSTASDVAEVAGGAATAATGGGVPVGLIIGGAVVIGGGLLVAAAAVVGGAIFFLSRQSGGPASPPGGPVLGTGDVQITLRWDTTADLDLHVVDPFGEEIYYDNEFADSGGELDVDSNADCSSATTSPVENVFWPTGGAPGGQYTVIVDYYYPCEPNGIGPADYEVTIMTNGQLYQRLTGTLDEFGVAEVITFDY
jgi:hypothetical protein